MTVDPKFDAAVAQIRIARNSRRVAQKIDAVGGGNSLIAHRDADADSKAAIASVRNYIEDGV